MMDTHQFKQVLWLCFVQAAIKSAKVCAGSDRRQRKLEQFKVLGADLQLLIQPSLQEHDDDGKKFD